ncbi:hypothetical protein SELMODRAFT_402081 [Selaginella moellendorffii]|uniref:RING-type E3 ubiquitin transferase n=1 Tax=Selaginella moellendorffii TaxID=88036 RepID=D8QPI7_SELML|nr:uncharacterized protein LOC9656252 [Selaginella moellendorffii]EFJ37628.1 hypothetical protein SELMODRAFT_402081 [Selaginella moellendorffii]|eukprot:XP_002960089.1 uncharacterized protein LOC9656252 [Selaginella moellendorffii]
MPSFVVVAGADVEMAEGNGISARIDLNLHLAPPATADFLRLGPGIEEEERQQQQQPREGGQNQGGNLQRRILPRFGPGIHGVFLDLHPDSDSEARIRPAVEHSMRPPIRHHRFRRYSTRGPSLVSVAGLEERSRRLFHDSRSPQQQQQQPQQDTSKDKAPAKESEDDSSKDETGVVKRGGNENFECNVCLDMAVEPVVTVCGHLFCWSCLHQWLYVHSENEECPVCKGSVGENSIIPIYGRGSSSSARQELSVQDDEARVPPRPHARRVDSLRQRVEAETTAVPVEDRDAEQDRINLNEMLRMSRVVRLLHDNMSSRFRRRMSERREHYRTPSMTTTAASTQPVEFTVGEFEARAATFQDDYVRQLSASRADTEERVNAIRARLASLVETIESHRRQAASMAARFHDTAREAVALTATVGVSAQPSDAVIATAETIERSNSVSSVARPRESEEGSTSGGGDSEVLHSRKRRRLN